MRLLAALVPIAALSSLAAADMWMYNVSFTGLNEVPPNASPAMGTAFGEYDADLNLLHVTFEAMDLLGPSTAAHIHGPAGPGEIGPVLFDMGGVFGGTTYMQHNIYVLTDEQETQFLSGLFYANVHSSVFPGGEVRAQMVPEMVPSPAGAALLGLGALAGLRRRR